MVQLDWSFILDIAYGGVNHSLPGNGGPACARFLSTRQRVLETVSYMLFCVVLLYFILPRCRIPEKLPPLREGTLFARRLLLVLLCVTFAIEAGFKVATKQVIYLLNPCHVLNVLQIYLLAAKPSKHVLCLFRINMYILFGALLAVVFPVVNTRLLPFEVEIYWIQHLLILLIVPVFLIHCRGPFVMDPLLDISWGILTIVIYATYMFLVLQPLGMLSEVNLNNMVCPAVSDPFVGPYYRVMACIYIPLLIILCGKGVTIVGEGFVRIVNGPEKTD
ncbi:transmembrane protein 164 [Nematostella vectensis]|uniref:transmembrane protein 164 n=1 Tax=Nematostella vectensis TaxID=45351 RepID=UPI002077172B|nr:transmembrane protein 164 [Nematostella vectensis]